MYDVYYRVHAQNFGWMGWAKNDEEAGTSGYGFRLEAIEIVLVKKGENPDLKPCDYNKPFSDIIEKFEKQEQELISNIEGYCWYLEGHDYSYIKFEKIEWYDHYMLDVNTFGIKYVDGKIVIDYENWEWSESSEIHNMLIKNPIDLDYKYIRDYKMHIKDEKLYITINDIEYAFYKSTEDKSKVERDLKPYFLGDKTINITTDEALYDLFYDFSPSFTNCNVDIKLLQNQDVIEWTWIMDEKRILIHPVKPGSVQISISNPNNSKGDILTINIETGNKTKVEKIYHRGDYIRNFIYENEAIIYNWSLWDNLATSQDSDNYRRINVEVYPYTATNKTILYSSSDTSVVEVTTDGRYITKKPGEAIITIKSKENENIKNEIKIVVQKNEMQVELNAWFQQDHNEIRVMLGARYGSYDYLKEIEIYRDGELIAKLPESEEEKSIYRRYVTVKINKQPGNYKIVGKVTSSDGDIVVKEYEIAF